MLLFCLSLFKMSKVFCSLIFLEYFFLFSYQAAHIIYCFNEGELFGFDVFFFSSASISFVQTIIEIYLIPNNKIIMSDTQKILLPKLKISYSLRNSAELSPNKSSSAGSLYVSPSSLYPSQKTIAQSKQPLRSKTKSQTNNSIQVKLKYNSRSPYYFKKQERTDQLIKFLENQQKMIVDKFPRPILVPTQKQNIIYQTQDKLKKGFEKRKKETKFDFCKKSLERTLTETNYSNFCPSKIPIVKSLHKVHPSSHVLYNS